MSTTTFLFIVLGCWLVIGGITGFLMRRRGHDLFSWWLLGALFGPLALGMAIQTVRMEGRVARSSVLQAGEAEGGPVDLLAGYDGSAESEASIRSALTLLGDRIGRLVVARVVDYDLATTGKPREMQAQAHDSVLAFAKGLAPHRPEVVILAGPPTQALEQHMADGGFDLLVIGCRGHGASPRLLGSVASTLAHRGGFPVLIGGCSKVSAASSAEAAAASRA